MLHTMLGNNFLFMNVFIDILYFYKPTFMILGFFAFKGSVTVCHIYVYGM